MNVVLRPSRTGLRARTARLIVQFTLAFSGLHAPDAGAQDISIGQIGPFSGSAGALATEIHDGANACFEQVNREGGIHGRKLALFTLDDAFEPAVFEERFEQALARHPVALLPLVGSPAIGRLLKSGLLETSGMVVIGMVPESDVYQHETHNNLFHISVGDRAQFERILQHCKTLGISRVHVVFQDLSIGGASLAAIVASSERIGGPAITATRVAGTASALAAAAHLPAVQGAESIIVFGVPDFMTTAVVQLRAAGLRQSIFVLSYLDARLAQRAIGTEAARGLGITQTFPNPNGHVLPLQRDFRAAMQKASLGSGTYTNLQLEGYIAARVLVAGLKRIDGPPTPVALARAIREMGEFDLGGFRLNFSRSNVGSTWTDIGVMSSAGKLEY